MSFAVTAVGFGDSVVVGTSSGRFRLYGGGGGNGGAREGRGFRFGARRPGGGSGGAMEFPGGSDNYLAITGTSHPFLSGAETFHTPSLGDEEFEIPPIPLDSDPSLAVVGHFEDLPEPGGAPQAPFAPPGYGVGGLELPVAVGLPPGIMEQPGALLNMSGVKRGGFDPKNGLE
ncbi:TOX high mobility group box family member 4-like [Melospiza melodia melodia]|uniref:TOX high mobility group box family member 4-like n=1 Tax=Melospiza melodia melodia TaxID=1914991 RepID=UPI002FD323DA